MDAERDVHEGWTIYRVVKEKSAWYVQQSDPSYQNENPQKKENARKRLETRILEEAKVYQQRCKCKGIERWEIYNIQLATNWEHSPASEWLTNRPDLL